MSYKQQQINNLEEFHGGVVLVHAPVLVSVAPVVPVAVAIEGHPAELVLLASIGQRPENQVIASRDEPVTTEDRKAHRYNILQ